MKKEYRLIIIGVIGIGALVLVAFSQGLQRFAIERLQQEPLQIEVAAIRQSQGTSCGEAVIVMAYNYTHLQTPLLEHDVIEYATTQGYFTPKVPPFTSPINMVKLARQYEGHLSTGTVLTANQGLLLLIQRLRAGEPVIICVCLLRAGTARLTISCAA